jgi:hypothetical protein
MLEMEHGIEFMTKIIQIFDKIIPSSGSHTTNRITIQEGNSIPLTTIISIPKYTST